MGTYDIYSDIKNYCEEVLHSIQNNKAILLFDLKKLQETSTIKVNQEKTEDQSNKHDKDFDVISIGDVSLSLISEENAKIISPKMICIDSVCSASLQRLIKLKDDEICIDSDNLASFKDGTLHSLSCKISENNSEIIYTSMKKIHGEPFTKIDSVFDLKNGEHSWKSSEVKLNINHWKGNDAK